MSYNNEYLAKAMQSGGNGFGYASNNNMGRYASSSYSSGSCCGSGNYESNPENKLGMRLDL
jgi:hypothetical protein